MPENGNGTVGQPAAKVHHHPSKLGQHLHLQTAAQDGRKASDAEVMAMTEATVTFKEVLIGDRTLLARRRS